MHKIHDLIINMSLNLRFDGRVAVVTGTGAGLGRAYALEFAKRGAKVVVNDLGVSLKGEGFSTNAADLVVQQIKKNGGEATANYDSVEFGDKIIETAIKAYGRVDIVINNAGILRDVSLLKMTDEDWDLIMKVHLKGAFSVSRAAWKHMRQQKYGRIINTSSASGLYGNFGQCNYATAKLGLHGLTQTLAKEGDKNNIRVNTIAPSAVSRMTNDMFTPELNKTLTPEKIVPLVIYLSHESNTENGSLYDAMGGYFGKLRWQRAQGGFFSGKFSAEDVQSRWNEITSFDRTNDYPNALLDTLQRTMGLIETSKPKI
jgi:NAD(P)-dependent dehydrogenase (short-subunit alcohol dehydrogenase family)